MSGAICTGGQGTTSSLSVLVGGAFGSEPRGPCAQDEEPAEGILLCGRYRVGKAIARGGTAVLFAGTDELLGDTIALKVVRRDGLLHSAEGSQCVLGLRGEALATMRLCHPHILRVHTYDRHGALEFLVMELVLGEDLAQGRRHQPEGRYPLRQVLRVALESLRALEHAHSLGIVHNDLKPSNLLLAPTGAVKVCDFGLANLAPRRGHKPIGTPAFMSPERVLGEPPDGRSDLYSLAATLWTLGNGQTLFGLEDSALWHHVHTPPPPSSHLPAAMAEVLGVALSKRPEDRFPSAGAMFKALVGVMQSAGLSAATSPRPVAPPVDTHVTNVPRALERAAMARVRARTFRSAHSAADLSVQSFFIDRTPVTNEAYGRFLAASGAPAPAHWLGGRWPAGKADHPVVGVSLDEARSYAAWSGKRLPTAVEWEAAARGEYLTSFPWGDDWDQSRANCPESGAQGTTAVEAFPLGTSSYGMLDAVGNVWEWTEVDARVPAAPAMSWVLGGSFRHPCGADGHIPRTAIAMTKAYEYVGFRCALTDEEQTP